MGGRIGKMYDFVNTSCFSPSQRKARNWEISALSASLRLAGGKNEDTHLRKAGSGNYGCKNKS